jgi:L,D-peptidoglycan transpeptidase YkuD (ErfK/YbiS/YcfS/YnhG family)
MKHGNSRRTSLSVIRVSATPGNRRTGQVKAGAMVFACALGKGGFTHAKREGDGGTPVARLSLRRVWWRADHGRRPRTLLPVRAIRRQDGWCDAPRDRNYNRPVTLPYPASHEKMWRDDHLYDLVLELGWNDAPRQRGKGSAIFLHIARTGFLPTEGCVALRVADAYKLLARMGPNTRFIIG